MELIPNPWWPSVLMAALLLFDALASIRPPGFIRNCLNGVGFPKDWWWTLIVIKLAAVAGLIAGVWIPGIGLATHGAVVLYFLSAAYAHLRSKYLGRDFWLNCLGMLVVSVATPIIAFGG